MEATNVTNNNKVARIKCTFVELYDQRGNRVFSVQRDNFGDQPLGIAANMEKTDSRGRVEIKPSADLVSVLKKYVTLCNVSKGAKAGVASIRTNAAQPLYVRRNSCNWSALSGDIDKNGNTVVDTANADDSGKRKLALIAAAVLALLNN